MLCRNGISAREATRTHVYRRRQARCRADPLVCSSKFAEFVDPTAVGACCTDYTRGRDGVLSEEDAVLTDKNGASRIVCPRKVDLQDDFRSRSQTSSWVSARSKVYMSAKALTFPAAGQEPVLHNGGDVGIVC